MAKKSMSEKVIDIFVGTVARDMSKTALKKAKELWANQSNKKSKLRRKPAEPTDPELEPEK